MAKKSSEKSVTEYGMDLSGGGKSNRFSMQKERQDSANGGRKYEAPKHTSHQVWQFTPEKHMLIPGEIIKDYDTAKGTTTGHAFRYAIKKADNTRDESMDVIPVANWDERSPVIDGVTLKSLNAYPNVGGREGIILFIHLPMPGNIRQFRQSDEYKTATEFRADFIGAEIAYASDDVKRQTMKRGLRKPFVFPGADGDRLENSGVKRIWPQFESEEETKMKVYYDHVLVLSAGAEIEVIMEYTAGTTVSNYYSIKLGSDLIPMAFNVRDPAGPDMMAAHERAAEIVNAVKLMVEKRRQKF